MHYADITGDRCKIISCLFSEVKVESHLSPAQQGLTLLTYFFLSTWTWCENLVYVT